MSQSKVALCVKELSKELRLTALRENFVSKANEARQEQNDYIDYLHELLELECFQRRQNSIKRKLRESQLPLEKSFELLDIKRFGRKVAQQIKILRDGSFIDRCENVIAFGKPGNGKTHLLAALGQELVRSGKRIYFSSCSLLVQQMLRAKKELLLDKYLKKMSRFDALNCYIPRFYRE